MENYYTLELNNDIKNEENKLNKLLEEIKFVEKKNQFKKNEIKNKIKEIENLQKQLIKINNNKDVFSTKEKKSNKENNNIVILKEQIQKRFKEIQYKSNLNLQEKYKKNNIEYLLYQEKFLVLHYIILKKLDIKEELFNKLNIIEKKNIFENLQNLEKINNLNYKTLKYSGVNLVFRLTSEEKFQDLFNECCSIWKINKDYYNLYDDGFNNISLSLEENIQEYFSYHKTIDPTLPNGYVCFYIIEKMKNQNDLLFIQNKSINKKEDIDGQSYFIQNKSNDLINCYKLIEEGKILKGLNKYKYDESYDINHNFFINMINKENNIIFLILSVIYFIISFISITLKLRNYNHYNFLSNIYNEICHNYDVITNNNKNFKTLKYYFETLIPLIQNENIYYKNANLRFYGLSSIRIFKTLNKNCISKFKETFKTDEYFFNLNSISKCYYPYYYKEKYKNKEDIVLTNNLIISYNKDTNFKHTHSTINGKIDKTGHLIRLNNNDENNYTHVNNLITNLLNKENLFDNSILGFELNFILYHPNYDIFLANDILILRKNNEIPFISSFKSIPFDTNVYEKQKILYFIDIIKFFLSLFLLLPIFFHLYHKIKMHLKVFNLKTKIIIIINHIIQFKYILLITIFICDFWSLIIFLNFKINTKDYFNNALNKNFIDFIYIAKKQKTAKFILFFNIILISIYIFFYFSLLSKIEFIFISLKKSQFEYFLIIFSFFIILIGISIHHLFIYGSYIKYFSTFKHSFLTNLQLILFIEKSYIFSEMITHFDYYTIFFLLIEIILLKFFLFNFFYAILVEYMRYEKDKYKYIIKKNELTFFQKLKIFIYNFKIWKYYTKKSLIKIIEKPSKEISSINSEKNDSNII